MAECRVVYAVKIAREYYFFKLPLTLECRFWQCAGLAGAVCRYICRRNIQSAKLHFGAHELKVAGINCSEQGKVFYCPGFTVGDYGCQLSSLVNPYAAFFFDFRGFLYYNGNFLVFFYIVYAVIVVVAGCEYIAVGFYCNYVFGRV